ncbi:MAG: protein kinase [Acidobacteriota bacterium]
MKQCVECKQSYADNLVVCPSDGMPLLAADGLTKSDPLIGKLILEKYRIDRLLGRGGMGAVYEGRHLLLDRQVAIKVMNPQIVADDTAVARFIREAKTAARLDHTNAITIHDFGVFDGQIAFIVMEFINGQSLRSLLAISGVLSLQNALDLFMPVCAVVEAAHQSGIIHRDLKPENIMLKETSEGLVVKVVDFGLAKLSSGDTGKSAKLTKTGEVMGTPQYMAPELYEGESASASSDIYALGIIFYEMITGSAPFTGSLETVIAGHLFKEAKPAASINPAITADIDEVIRLALKKSHTERINSANEFAAALRTAAGFAGSLAKEPFSNLPTVIAAPLLPPTAENLKPSLPTSAVNARPLPTAMINNGSLSSSSTPLPTDKMNMLTKSIKTEDTAIVGQQGGTKMLVSGVATAGVGVAGETRLLAKLYGKFSWPIIVLAALLPVALGSYLVYSFTNSSSSPAITAPLPIATPVTTPAVTPVPVAQPTPKISPAQTGTQSRKRTTPKTATEANPTQSQPSTSSAQKSSNSAKEVLEQGFKKGFGFFKKIGKRDKDEKKKDR